jgi:sugar O-acyltransferase (sialic acid O-acetyltransferase NeuD family)
MSARMRIAVIGAGGQGRETAWLIRELARGGAAVEFAGFVVSDLGRIGPRDSADELLGDYDALAGSGKNVDALALGIGAPATRLAVARELRARFPGLDWPVLVHPSVHIDRGSARLERGVMLAAGTLGTVNITVEEFGLLNFGCTIGHESHVGAGSVVNPGANVSGGVRIGRATLIGTGAQILQYVIVGDGAVVGAGAVVTQDVPDGVTVVGVPARARETP